MLCLPKNPQNSQVCDRLSARQIAPRIEKHLENQTLAETNLMKGLIRKVLSVEERSIQMQKLQTILVLYWKKLR